MQLSHLLLKDTQRLLCRLRKVGKCVRLDAALAGRLAANGRAEELGETLQPAGAVIRRLARLSELANLELTRFTRLDRVPKQIEILTHHAHLSLDGILLLT